MPIKFCRKLNNIANMQQQYRTPNDLDEVKIKPNCEYLNLKCDDILCLDDDAYKHSHAFYFVYRKYFTSICKKNDRYLEDTKANFSTMIHQHDSSEPKKKLTN